MSRERKQSNLIGVSRAARELNLSESAVRQAADSGALPCVRDSANRRQFSREALRSYGQQRSR